MTSVLMLIQIIHSYRELATTLFRSGPEWEKRFGRSLISNQHVPTLGPYFMVEQYTEYQGESFCTKFDPNSLMYILRVSPYIINKQGMLSTSSVQFNYLR